MIYWGMSMKKVNVLLVIDTMFYAGPQNHVAQLVNGLDRERYAVYVCCLKEIGELGRELSLAGASIFSLRLKRLFGLKALVAVFRLARWLRIRQIDIVHTFLFAGRVFGTSAAGLARVPAIVAGIRGEAVMWDKLRQRMAGAFAARFVNLFLPNSQYLKKILMEKEGIGEERIRVVRNGVDLERFSPGVSPGVVRSELGAGLDGKVIGCVANLLPVKGVDTFLEAAGIVARHRDGVSFLVVGAERPSVDGDFKEKLELICRDPVLRGRVKFLGERKDMPRIYDAMDILVLPSRSEGMSNVLLEAMAMSLPVIASDIEPNREVVVEGLNALFFPAGEASVLAQKIEGLLDDGCMAKRFGKASRRIAEESFSLERMISDVEAAYNGALTGGDVVTEYFDKKARGFDAIYSGKKSAAGRLLDRVFRWDMLERMNIVLRTASETGAGRILDVGCGSGRIAVPLARGTSARVVGIDTAPRMIDMAGGAAAAAGVGERCTFRVGDIFSVSPDDRYDMSIAIGLFDYIFEPLPILERMAVLTEGVIVASLPRKNIRAAVRKIRLKICGCPVRFFSRKEVEKLFADAGLEIVDFKSVGNLYIVRARPVSRRPKGGAPTKSRSDLSRSGRSPDGRRLARRGGINKFENEVLTKIPSVVEGSLSKDGVSKFI